MMEREKGRDCEERKGLQEQKHEEAKEKTKLMELYMLNQMEKVCHYILK